MDAMNLFKGKRVDNGEWVIGNLIFSEDALVLCQDLAQNKMRSSAS